jgi:hypothetical protein
MAYARFRVVFALGGFLGRSGRAHCNKRYRGYHVFDHHPAPCVMSDIARSHQLPWLCRAAAPRLVQTLFTSENAPPQLMLELKVYNQFDLTH